MRSGASKASAAVRLAPNILGLIRRKANRQRGRRPAGKVPIAKLHRVLVGIFAEFVCRFEVSALELMPSKNRSNAQRVKGASTFF
jgi:hypothetical protein